MKNIPFTNFINLFFVFYNFLIEIKNEINDKLNYENDIKYKLENNN